MKSVHISPTGEWPMRMFTAPFLFSLLLISCASPKWQMQAPCPGSDNEEIISTLTALIGRVGMDILIVNTRVGILQATGKEPVKLFSPALKTTWNFTIENDTIFAFAKSVKIDDKSSDAPPETYYTNENAPKDAAWFWNVYDGIRSLCEDQPIVFVEQ